MEFRSTLADYRAGQGEPNRRTIKAIVDGGTQPGLIAYAEGRVAAWCSLAPRDELIGLDERPQFARIDDEPVWSLVCFFVATPFRRRGMMARLIEAALVFAHARGAAIVEVYPREIPDIGHLATGFLGSVETLRRAGFSDVAPRDGGYVVMRRDLRN